MRKHAEELAQLRERIVSLGSQLNEKNREIQRIRKYARDKDSVIDSLTRFNDRAEQELEFYKKLVLTLFESRG